MVKEAMTPGTLQEAFEEKNGRMIVQIPITLQHFQPDCSTDFEHKLRDIFWGWGILSFYALVFFYIYKPTHPVHLGQWDIYYDTSQA